MFRIDAAFMMVILPTLGHRVNLEAGAVIDSRGFYDA